MHQGLANPTKFLKGWHPPAVVVVALQHNVGSKSAGVEREPNLFLECINRGLKHHLCSNLLDTRKPRTMMKTSVASKNVTVVDPTLFREITCDALFHVHVFILCLCVGGTNMHAASFGVAR